MEARAVGTKRQLRRRSEPLTLDEITDVTLRLSRQVGVDAVTMKMVGDELGVTPMATYRLVGSRHGLLEHAALSVLNRVAAADSHHGSWEDRLRLILRSFKTELEPYPWVGQFFVSQGVVPARPAKVSALFPVLREAGLDEPTAWKVLGFVNAFVAGSVYGVGADWGGRRRERLGRDVRRSARQRPGARPSRRFRLPADIFHAL